MTRYRIFRILIGSGAILVAIGCGDVGQAVTDIADSDVADADVGDDRSAAAVLETELRLACASACDAMRDCGWRDERSECLDLCFASYPTDLGVACTRAQIDVLNCSSGSGCTVSLLDGACDEAVLRARTSCPRKQGVREIIRDSDVATGEDE